MNACIDVLGSNGDVVTHDIGEEGLALALDPESTFGLRPADDSESEPLAARLRWDRRRATCLLEPLSSGADMEGTSLDQGARIPLDANAEFWLAGRPARFRRQPAAPRLNGTAAPEVDLLRLAGRCLVIGRFKEPQASEPPSIPAKELRWDLDKADLTISHRHVVISERDGGFLIEDVSSSGALLNAQTFQPTQLIYGDRLKIGDYHFDFTGRGLRWVDAWQGGSLRARDVTVVVPTRAGPKEILRRVSLDVKAGDFNFLGVLGGSGQGKSTLMNALCGINPASSGEVEISGVPLKNRSQLKDLSIGYVPQDDLVHRELTVEDAIVFSAKLRFKLKPQALAALVEGIMARMVLLNHRTQRISMLSGGQRKRVSIATEILAKPAVLFLDEPSSGLDPEIERKLMVDLQTLAKTGITVVATTHVLHRAYLFSKICFIHDGRLVFFGTVEEAGEFFFRSVSSSSNGRGRRTPLEEVYRKLSDHEDGNAESIEAAFASFSAARRRASVFPPPPPMTDNRSTPRRGVGFWSSLVVLIQRQWAILRADRLNVLFLFAQAIIIGGLVGWVSDDVGFRLFLGLIATMWFGCSNAAQQIVSELPIFRRERVSGLGLNSYILSKFLFLFTITALQSLLLLASLTAIASSVHPPDLPADKFLANLREREATSESVETDSNRFHTITSPDQKNFPANEPRKANEPVKAIDVSKLEVHVIDAAGTARELPRESFSVVGSGAAVEVRLADSLPVGSIMSITAPLLPVITVREHVLLFLARHLSMELNLLDSGETDLKNPETEDPIGGRSKGLPLDAVVWACLGWRLGGLLLGALAGVSLGLLVSALAQSATQAVLWVPLILIPQILLGGFVVTLPEMSRSVRIFCGIMPSFAAERLIEISLLYGQRVPSMSNETKIANFLSSERGGRGEEQVLWIDHEGKERLSEYEKLSPHNTAWQNLAIRHDQVGQHRQKTVDGQQYKPNKVNMRRDVLYTWRTLFVDSRRAVNATMVLLAWTFGCYGIIAAALQRKQFGK